MSVFSIFLGSMPACLAHHQTVFAGPYLPPEVRKQFMHDYLLFNAGVMAMPIDLPGSTYWRAVRAVQRIIAILADCAKQVNPLK